MGKIERFYKALSRLAKKLILRRSRYGNYCVCLQVHESNVWLHRTVRKSRYTQMSKMRKPDGTQREEVGYFI